MIQAEIQRHIQLLLDGEISADEFAVLETELLENPEALETYRAYARLHCGLEKHCDIREMVENPPVVPVARILAQQRKFIIKVSVFGAAAIVLLTAVAMWSFNAPVPHPPLAKFQISPGSDFSLTHGGASDAPDGMTMAAGSRLVLRHGVAELQLPHDVRAVVEAPAEMTLRDDRTLEFAHGRALFQVPTLDGRGFTVVTPHQRIVDLGTAFGVDFPQGGSEVALHVLTGRVRVDSNRGTHGEIIQAKRSVLLAGPRVQREIDPPAIGFLRKLPPTIDMLVDENFATGLMAGQNYVIRMDPTVIRDLAGNDFRGIVDDTTWNFSGPRAITAHAATLLADDFADVAKVGNTATLGAWDSVSGIAPPATSLSFFKGGTGTAVGFHHASTGELDVNNNMIAGGWDTSLVLALAGSTAAIDLTSLVVDLRLTNKVGADQTTHGKNGRMIVELVGSVSGSLGTVDSGNRAFPRAEYTCTLDLTSLPTLDGSETYTLHLKARGTGHGHNKSLQSLELKGDIAAISGSALIASTPFGDPLPGDQASARAGDDPTGVPDERDDSPPVLVALHPADDSKQAAPDGQLKVLFNEPVKLGTGRVFIQNVSNWSETTLVVGSRRLSIDGRTLTINPPAELRDGAKSLGWLAGWQSDAPVAFLNPRGDGKWYSHPGLQDDSPTRGQVGPMRSPGMVGIRRAIRREIGTISAGSRYTVSTAIGVRAGGAQAKSTFPGYTIRLSSGDTVLAQLSSNTPPGPANGVSSVGFSWDATTLPDGVHPGDPLTLAITPNPTSSPGYLDLNAVRVSVLGQTGR